MWLGLFLMMIIVVAALLSIFSGGIFTIVVLPGAVIVSLIAVVVIGLSRGAAWTSPRETEVDPLPHSAHYNTSQAPSTPDQLVDARQREQ